MIAVTNVRWLAIGDVWPLDLTLKPEVGGAQEGVGSNIATSKHAFFAITKSS